MENRPAPLRSRRVCRFCLTESEPLSYIYERDHSKPFQVPLTLQIMSCVAIEVYAADGMPQMICSTCRWNLDRSYKFKLQCKKADEALRAYPLSGVLPRPFPPIPNEPPTEAGMKRSADQRMQSDQPKKPRVEGPERRETRERERERQREAEKQRELYEEEQDGGSEGDQEASNEKDDRKLEPGEIRVHACEHCDRTFPLRQALALHMQRAHRDRNYKCTECDRTFFSRSDLGKHMATHSEDKPFACPVCQRQFARANLLQRHEKMHRDEPRFGCQHCDREFFTTDELEKHEETSHKSQKPYQCNICNKRFTYKQGLERHEVLHSEDKTFVCEYCKEAFRTSTKLARHLSTHAGHRPYMCKLCPRSFLLSHHLTRHMRSHSVEKRHVCEDCGKAFKRKESLDVHQLTHAKRTGMGLTCDVCQESCRNRADYVTHIKQHIEAGEKMGPDGLQPDSSKDKLESDSEEEEEEDQYSDGDDDYEPPAYIVKKLPKNEPAESDEEAERNEKEDRKEQVVFVRGKDGNVVRKSIKTLMPIQRRGEMQECKTKLSPGGQSASKISPAKQAEESQKGRMDDTEAQVQKIVASVFKEHKIPLKHQNIPQEQGRESTSQVNSKSPAPQSNHATSGQAAKDDTGDASAGTQKSVNTIKVTKRIVVRKPAGSGGETPAGTPSGKEGDSAQSGQATPASGHKVIKRVIVRRIIRHGDTTREVIMNPDGTIIDPSELAKLQTGNVIKRVVVKKPVDKSQSGTQNVAQSPPEQKQQTAAIKASDPLLGDSPKFELKTSQPSTQVSSQKSPTTVQNVEVTKEEATGITGKGDRETKEKLELLEKRVEQQRLKIEELQARKQQEYEQIDDSLPERHDESEDEQQLPLKRVFVKRKQSIYDEEQEYNDSDEKNAATGKGKGPQTKRDEGKSKNAAEAIPTAAETPAETPAEPVKKDYKKPAVMSTSKVYGNKKIIVVKTEDVPPMEDMSHELSSILDSTENVIKMQENVLNNLSQISVAGDMAPQPMETDNIKEENTTTAAPLEEELAENEAERLSTIKMESECILEATDESQECQESEQIQPEENVISQEEEVQEDVTLSLGGQDLSETTDIFETSDQVLSTQKSDQTNAEDSIMELAEGNDTINLNDTNDSQDSLEDKLSQMEG